MNPLQSAKLDLVVAYAINSMFWSKYHVHVNDCMKTKCV